MALTVIKSIGTNASLDILSLIDNIAKDVLSDVANSFYPNGSLHENHAVKALKKIQGRAEVLRSIVDNSK